MITIALLICLIGLVIWFIATKWKGGGDAWFAECGRIMFAFGLLAWLLTLGNKAMF